MVAVRSLPCQMPICVTHDKVTDDRVLVGAHGHLRINIPSPSHTDPRTPAAPRARSHVHDPSLEHELLRCDGGCQSQIFKNSFMHHAVTYVRVPCMTVHDVTQVHATA